VSSRVQGERRTETTVAALLDVGARAAFVLLLIGAIAMLVSGVQPQAEPVPPPALGSWLAALLTVQPEAFIWAGIGLTTILPAATVVAAAFGFGRAGDRRGALTACAVLVALSVTIVVAIVSS
jgi:uncharacterized membrane protein